MALIIRPEMASVMSVYTDHLETEDFQQWWNDLELASFQLTCFEAKTLIDFARSIAEAFGVDPQSTDIEGRHRLYLLALATHLMPEMRGNQYMLAADAVFDNIPIAERIKRLIAISQNTI